MNDQSPVLHEDEPLALDILVIDDEKNIRTTVAMCLEGAGCHVTGVATAAAARAALARQPFDVAFLDLRLGDTNGLDLLPELLASRPGLAIVVVTAYATIDTAVDAIRRGAVDYLPKPFSPRSRTVASEPATGGIMSSAARIAGAALSRSTSGTASRSCCSRSASRRVMRCRAATCSTAWRNCAGVKGFGR